MYNRICPDVLVTCVLYAMFFYIPLINKQHPHIPHTSPRYPSYITDISLIRLISVTYNQLLATLSNETTFFIPYTELKLRLAFHFIHNNNTPIEMRLQLSHQG